MMLHVPSLSARLSSFSVLFVHPSLGPAARWLRTPSLDSSVNFRRQCVRRKYICASAKLSVTVYMFGRNTSKDDVYDLEIQEYTKRLSPMMNVSCRWLKSELKGVETILDFAKDRGWVICLDESGKHLDSSFQFSNFLYNRLERGGSRLAFVVGDAEGLPQPLKDASQSNSFHNIEALSLSPLTLTHKMVRLFLVEQVYRASEIRKGTKYHK